MVYSKSQHQSLYHGAKIKQKTIYANICNISTSKKQNQVTSIKGSHLTFA